MGMNAKNLSKKWCQKNGIAVVERNECVEESTTPMKVAVPNANDEFLLEKIRFVTQQRVIPEQHSPAEIRLMHSHAESIDDEELLEHLNRLEISASLQNPASIAVATRAGFAQEGTCREYEFINGHFEDHLRFSRLAKDR